MVAPPARLVSVTVVLPCLDEAAALPGVLAAVPPGYQALVVDNGSRDGSAELARRLGATVVSEASRGYGAAVHAGIEAATTEVVAVMDCDGSMDPGELVGPVDAVRSGAADLVCGRRRLVQRGSWPWHARVGNAVLAGMIRWSTGVSVHDIAPVRVARRADLLALGLRDRRFGYPLETVLVAAQSGWRVVEVDITYRRRSGGRSKVSGTIGGTLRVGQDFWAVLRTRWQLRRTGPGRSHHRPDADGGTPDAGRSGPARPALARPDLARPDLARPDLARPDLARPDLDPFEPSSGSVRPDPRAPNSLRSDPRRPDPPDARHSDPSVADPNVPAATKR